MRNRCHNPSVASYADYGARGIKVCDRWQSFENFIADMGERPEGMTVERVDSNGNYEPSNCRWATRTEQGANKRNNLMLSDGKETLHLAEWARRLNISHAAILRRLANGWDEKRAVTEPAPERPNGKLTIEQAQFALDNFPRLSAPKIGEMIGTSGTSVLNIVKRKTFKYLERSVAQAA